MVFFARWQIDERGNRIAWTVPFEKPTLEKKNKSMVLIRLPVGAGKFPAFIEITEARTPDSGKVIRCSQFPTSQNQRETRVNCGGGGGRGE